MSDERIVEVMSKSLALYYEYECATDNPAAQAVLAALRADGWELYRPEECVEFTVEHGGSYPDPYSGEEREAEPVMRSSQSEPARCYLNYGSYRLVPVEGEK